MSFYYMNPFTTELNKRITFLCGERKLEKQSTFSSPFFKYFDNSRKIKSFNKDFPAFINAFSSSMRIGLDHITALKKTAELFPEESEIRKEVEKVISNINSGMNESDAIDTFGEFTNSLDVKLFCSILNLSIKYGSSITVGLKRLLKVVRQRQVFNKKISSVLAMQKLSAVGILICFLTIIISQIVFNAEAVIETYKSELGYKILCLGFSLLIAGSLWMFSLARKKY